LQRPCHGQLVFKLPATFPVSIARRMVDKLSVSQWRLYCSGDDLIFAGKLGLKKRDLGDRSER
jgi:hypothetical protein